MLLSKATYSKCIQPWGYKTRKTRIKKVKFSPRKPNCIISYQPSNITSPVIFEYLRFIVTAENTVEPCAGICRYEETKHLQAFPNSHLSLLRCSWAETSRVDGPTLPTSSTSLHHPEEWNDLIHTATIYFSWIYKHNRSQKYHYTWEESGWWMWKQEMKNPLHESNIHRGVWCESAVLQKVQQQT